MTGIGMRTPDAHVRVFSYANRSGSLGLTPGDQGEEYDIHNSIISIATSKQKSQPSGQFEITLAPDKNWLSILSPGSWLLIHMSPRRITEEERGSSSKETLKMIGRIDSVRVNVSVDQATGTRSTAYIVAGRDWAQVFESYLYIDTSAITGRDAPLALASRFETTLITNPIAPERTNVSSSTALVKFLINMWGTSGLAGNFALSDLAGNLKSDRFLPYSRFELPKKLSALLNTDSVNLSESIKVVAGKLVADDKYYDTKESIGILNPQSVIGSNMLWQLLSNHCCDVVNELVADLRWGGNNKPATTLYKRIRPFVLHSNISGSGVGIEGGKYGTDTEKVTSSFFRVRKIEIPADDVVSVDAGNNFRDVLNFIELLPDQTWFKRFKQSTLVVPNKNDAAVYSKYAFAREGIKQRLMSTIFTPPDAGGAPNPDALSEWLPVLKEWYFDTHKMLNGTISFMGQPDFIGVGDNIMFDAKLIGEGPNVAAQIKLGTSVSSEDGYKVLAHVESISHRFSYQPNGSRSFVTSINFVRGVITDSSGKTLTNPSAYGIETFADAVPVESSTPTNVVGVIGGDEG